MIAGVPAVGVGACCRSCCSDIGATQPTPRGSARYSWFIGCGLGFAIFVLLERRNPLIPALDATDEHVSDGTVAERTGVGIEA